MRVVTPCEQSRKRRQQRQVIPRNCWVISTLILAFSVVSASAEEEATIQWDDNLSDELSLCTVLMSFFFAFMLSLVASVFIYVTMLESHILAQYATEGVKVEAEIISKEFARGGNQNEGDICFKGGRKEYTVVIEYEHVVPVHTLRMKVRKHIRAMETDFVHPNHPELNSPRSFDSPDEEIVVDGPTWGPTTKDVDIENGATRPHPRVILNQDSFFQHFLLEERKLPLLVIPSHPKSGYPTRQLRRKMSVRHRTTFLLFVISLCILSLYCVQMAIGTVEQWYAAGGGFGWTSITTPWIVLVGAFCILGPLPCIHLSLRKSLEGMLEEEYFECGELMPTAQDDSTLSSGSSDMFLAPHFQYRSLDSGLSADVTK